MASPSPPYAAAGPALVPFTLNFTITNLHHTDDMWPGSAKFNATESVIQHLVSTPCCPLLYPLLPTLSQSLATLSEDMGGWAGRQLQVQNLELRQTGDVT